MFVKMPRDFKPSTEVAGCFIESEAQFLYLKRAPSRAYANTWGLPAGKIEPGEDSRSAVIREVFEETGLFIDTLDLKFIGSLYHRLADLDYTFHVYHKSFLHRPTPQLNQEHTQFQWLTSSQALTFPLIPGGADALRYFLERSIIKS